MSTGVPLYPKRDFSPYAVDGFDVRFESPRSSHSNASLLTKEQPRNFDEEKGHQYEDPTILSDQVRVLQEEEKRPRKRFNDMYEPHIPLKNLKDLRVRRTTDESISSDLSDTSTRESCLNRCILFFVLLTSITALILVVLLMLGKVGPSADRCVCNAEQGNTKGKRVRPCGRSEIWKGVPSRKILSICTVRLIRFMFKSKVIFSSAITPRWPDYCKLFMTVCDVNLFW